MPCRFLATQTAVRVAQSVATSRQSVVVGEDRAASLLRSRLQRCQRGLVNVRILTDVDLRQRGADLGSLQPGGQQSYVRDATAALNSIMLDECLITGTTFGTGYREGRGEEYERIEQLDVDLSGFTALCSSLSSSQIASISLRKCYLGPQALALLTDAIKVMTTLTELDVRWNEALDEVALAELRAAAPETCKILTD